MASAVHKASPSWFHPKAACSDCSAPLLTPNKLAQATFSSKELESNAGAPEEEVAQSIFPLWTMSQQAQTIQQAVLTSGDSPCTPAQSCMMHKVRSHDTPDSVIPLSLGSMSDSCYKIDRLHSSEWNTGSCNTSYQSKSVSAQSVENHPQFSTPSKNLTHNPIQLEVKGPEFPKENLLSLSLCRHDKPTQKPDFFVSSNHCVGKPPAQRVLATLKGSKLSPPLDDVQYAKRKSPSPLASRVSRSHLMNSHSSNTPCTSGIEHSLQQATGGKGSSKHFDSLPASETLKAKHAGDKQLSESYNYKPINLHFLPTCTNVHPNLHRIVAPPGASHQNIVPHTTINKATATSPALNTALSLVSPLQGGSARCMKMPKVRFCDSEHNEMDEVEKKQKECSTAKDVECIEVEASPVKRTVNFFIGDADDSKVQQPTKKRQVASEQMSNTLASKEVIDPSAELLSDSCIHQDHSGQECMKKQNKNSEGTCGCLEMQMETAYTNIATLSIKHEHIAGVESSPERQLIKLPKHEHIAAASKIEAALKLFAFPAYAQMPKALSTFSTGEPSLPLYADIEKRLLEQVDDGKDMRSMGTTDADWGKFLALSAAPTVKVTDKVDSNLLPYQQRFQCLQAFLKACDEFDQSNHMQALWSLSAAARSGYAVELEMRAIRLSLEEGKEMHRVKLLNVLGKHAQRYQIDVDATPYGPRLPAPGANIASNHT